jgi:hypothetical protein
VVDEGHLLTAGKTREYLFDFVHQVLRFGTVDLKFFQVDPDTVVEIQFTVVEQTTGGVKVPIHDGDPVDTQTLKPERGEKPGRP